MKIEQAKKRLIYSLLRLRLPLQTPRSALNEPLMFDFLDDPDGSHEAKNVTTGHDNGLITLAISEADDAIREERHSFGLNRSYPPRHGASGGTTFGQTARAKSTLISIHTRQMRRRNSWTSRSRSPLPQIV